jgi:hypothetical protein
MTSKSSRPTTNDLWSPGGFVDAFGFERTGEVVMLKEVLDGGDRALVISHADEVCIVFLADTIIGAPLCAGDSVMVEPRSGVGVRADPEERGRGAGAGGDA